MLARKNQEHECSARRLNALVGDGSLDRFPTADGLIPYGATVSQVSQTVILALG